MPTHTQELLRVPKSGTIASPPPSPTWSWACLLNGTGGMLAAESEAGSGVGGGDVRWERGDVARNTEELSQL